MVFGTSTFCISSKLVFLGLKMLKTFWLGCCGDGFSGEKQLGSGPVQQTEEISGIQRSTVRQDLSSGNGFETGCSCFVSPLFW